MKKKIKSFLKNFLKIVRKPEMKILPGQLAFYFVLAIVPTISLISYIASLLNLSSAVIYNFLSNAFSKELANILLSSELINQTTNGIRFIIVLAIAYFISSNGSNSIIVTSNAIYGIEPKGFVYRRIKSLIMTIMMLLLLIFILIVPVFGNKIINLFLMSNLNQDFIEKITWIINILQGPLNWFIIFLIIKLIYIMAPDRKVETRKVNYGAVFTTVCWVLGTSVYSFYINHLAHYNAYYGALAILVMLMLWLYYLAFVFTIGMALNYHKEEKEIEKNSTLKDTNRK